MLTLGLGMMIGAQAAGKIEGQHTPQAAKDLNAQVVAKSGEIKKLSESIEGEPSEEAKGQLATLDEEKAKLRQDELAALEWKALWSKPAIFAAVVMVVFVFLFSDKRKKENNQDNEQSN